MGTATARIIINRHIDDNQWEKYGLKDLKNTGRYYIARIVEKDGRVIDEVLVDKQSGTIQSLRGQNEMENWPGKDRSSASPDRNPRAKGSAEPMVSDFLLSAASFSPNLLGIKGLNHEIGEWVYTEGQGQPSGDASKTHRYAVIGGVEGDPEDKYSLPSVVKRFPWEGFEEIGFRTIESAAVGDSAK